MRSGFRSSAILLPLAILLSVAASGASLTVGSANDGNCLPFNCNDTGSASGQSIQYQQVYDSSLFGASPVRITAIAFSNTLLPLFGFANVPLLAGDYDFSFAYTSAGVNGLSTNLASNITSGQATFLVFNSPGISQGFSTLTFLGSAPFTYDPTLGNLLLNLVVSNQANVPSSSYNPANGFDSDDTGTSTSRAFRIGSNTAIADSTGLVTGFTYFAVEAPVPEPGTWALMGGGLLLLLAAKSRRKLAAVLPLGLAVIALAPGASAQPLHMTPRTVAIPQHTVPDATVSRTPAARGTNAATGTTIPTFTRTYSGRPQTFVGTDPATSNVTTTITVPLIPVILVINNSNGTTTTFDPTRKLNTAPTGSALSALLATATSPLFQNANYTTGGTNVGNAIQYGDAIQRATFWDSVSTTSPNWHVRVQYQIRPAVTLNVPLAQGSTSGPFALVDLNWLGGQLDRLATSYGSTTFPLFLSYEALETTGSGSSCCVLGYHTALQVGSNLQTYGYATYLDPNQIGGGAADVSVISHEIAEWLNDPFVNNIVDPWPAPFSFIPPGPPYDNNSCQNNLETGDPIEDRTDPNVVTFKITTFGRQYTLQNEALAPWFLRVSPSFSVNGYYTYLGPIDFEFTHPAPACGVR